jgi:feruloyl esterase
MPSIKASYASHSMIGRQRIIVSALMAALAVPGLPGCGGSSTFPSPPAASASSPTLTAAEACTALNGTAIPVSTISLATTGATITSTTLKPSATDASGNTTGEYCLVLGAINPVDPTAPSIQFQINLPTAWNGKAFHLTGGGYDGSLSDIPDLLLGQGGVRTTLQRGYATFISDSGHQASNTIDGSFGLNDEALANFLGDQLRKTRDVAMQVIQTRYGAAPSKTYIWGASEGGREAIYAADRWPNLYDGVVAYIFPLSLTALILQWGKISDALAAPGAWADPVKQSLVQQSVVAACDGLDGAVDGIVSNVAACHFDPQTLRCPGGADTGDTCLSDAQIAGVTSYTQALALPFPLAYGTTSYAGFSVFTGGAPVGEGTKPPANPLTSGMPGVTGFYDPVVKYWITRDPSYNTLSFSLTGPAEFQQRIKYISSKFDLSPALAAFAARGGKLIMMTGLADGTNPTQSVEDYYNRSVATMGLANVQAFTKFYELPGYGHASGVFNPSWDSLTALENWVEKGIVPTGQIAVDTNKATAGRTRPLCEYPTWPKYSGAGDVNNASSFICSTS